MLDGILNRNLSVLTGTYRQFATEKAACEACEICHDYGDGHVCQSEGNAKDPAFMFVGEAPGKDEFEQCRPFIGRAGQRLREELRKHKSVFSKQTTLISNVIACRPLNNVFPKGEESADFCMNQWLKREVEMLRPKVIVVLGSIAAKYVLDEEKISECRGSWRFIPKFRAWGFATYHPSYVLRCQNSPDKSFIVKVFEHDIETVAKGWSTIIASDNRLSMSEEEWKEQELAYSIQKKFAPIPR